MKENREYAQTRNRTSDYDYSILPILLKSKSHGRITLLANNNVKLINVKSEILPKYFMI